MAKFAPGKEIIMKHSKLFAMISVATLVLSGCSGASQTKQETAAAETTSESAAETETKAEISETAVVTSLSKIDNTKWNYNAEDDVYWQIGIPYCENPASEEYETMGIFVPGAYMTAADNGDGTFTCGINAEGTVGGYTAATAPIVIPVNTPGYSAMAAPSDYVSSAADYTAAGFIYANAGCRGRNEGAPAGITDLKAAVRYLRYNEGDIAGSMDRIFTFGMSGGGAQSALMGATGNSDLYTPYLQAIGAVEGVSDAVAGSMCWCPITNLDYANEAYEWNLGVTRSDLEPEMQELSDGMAKAFADYINEIGLKDPEGNVLVLTESEEGIYQAGSYYDYIQSEVERSLNNFLEDTEFPYTPQSQGMGRMGGAGMGGHGNGNRPEGMTDGGRDGAGHDNAAAGGFIDENGQMQNDGINRGPIEQESAEEVTYETVQDYIDHLNADNTWVIYDSESNTATITSVEDFVKNSKKASKSVGAFDDLDATQGENTLFGYNDGNGAHFDPVMAELLKDNETYGAAYAADMEKKDALGMTVDTRMNMYNPMYYLSDSYDGYQTSDVAEFWRIRTGINQGDTALSTEVNLTLALENYGRDVDFETIWGQGHTMAERTGNSTENFIEWVNVCLSK
jgi:hypothetical protein